MRLELCHKLVASRRVIGEHLGYQICRDPVWGMMLELYLARHEKRRVFLWSLCVFANIPTTSAIRKVDDMQESGLVTRQPGIRDNRKVEVRLTDDGSHVFENLLDRMAPIFSMN